MRRVIKIGGSLLSHVDLPNLISGWIDRQDQAENIAIFGGGQLIDAIRTLEHIRPSNPVDTHWRCVDLLEVTYQVASSWFDWQLVGTCDQLDDRLRSGFALHRVTLVAVKSFYDRNSTIDVPLDWQTTSDSIAAMLARRVMADELVLLKSCHVDLHADIGALVKEGVVDKTFPRLLSGIPRIRIEQLANGCNDRGSV